jgi:hypothetical protein
LLALRLAALVAVTFAARIAIAQLPPPQPLRPQVARCVPEPQPDSATNGNGNLPWTRTVGINFGYAVRSAADDSDDRKVGAKNATDRVEVCWAKGFDWTCPGSDPNGSAEWVVYDKVKKPTGKPEKTKVKSYGKAGAPEYFGGLPIDWADFANSGKILFIRVNGDSGFVPQAALDEGGWCPIAESLAANDIRIVRVKPGCVYKSLYDELMGL